MKTKGIEIGDAGYIIQGVKVNGAWTPAPGVVPPPFWARLKHRVAAAGRVDEFKSDEVALRDRERPVDGEIALFRLWVTKLGIELPDSHYPGVRLWPWSRGWTEDAVDSYLVAPAVAKEAA